MPVRTEILQPQLGVFAQTCCAFVTFAETLAVYLRMMSVDRGLDGGRSRYGAAFRRRGRRLRMHWRHEQLSIRMAVESALHHSFQQLHLVHACTQTTTFTNAATVLSVFLEPPVPTAVYAAPVPVTECATPAPVLELNCVSPSQQFPPDFMATSVLISCQPTLRMSAVTLLVW